MDSFDIVEGGFQPTVLDGASPVPGGAGFGIILLCWKKTRFLVDWKNPGAIYFDMLAETSNS